jgi:ornithine cyclodeaminase
MPDIKILIEKELRAQVGLNLASVDCIEQAFLALATQKIVMPPILQLTIPEKNGEVCIKTAYIPGLDSFAVKLSPGFFDNPKIGLPSGSGLMTLFSSNTGMLEAVLLDNGYLTDIRTAAAGAVAAKYCAREDSTRAAIIGAGEQARIQLEALMLVRSIQSATLWARDIEKAELTANHLSEKLNINVVAKSTIAEATKEADIIVCTTPSTSPLLERSHLHPGQHITAMGSDSEGKVELSPNIIPDSRYICDRLSQVRILGELRYAIEKGIVSADTIFSELGDVVAGTASGRESDDEITVCDLTGTGIQDTAIATLAYNLCLKQQAGINIET